MQRKPRYAFEGFVLDLGQQQLLGPDGQVNQLTPRLFNALALFVQRPGELLDKDSLMQALWPGLVVEDNNLSQVVSALRRALGDDTQDSRFIQTVPRRGFRFVAPVQRLDAHDAGGYDGPHVMDANAQPPTLPGAAGPSRRRWLGVAWAAAAVLAAGAGWQAWRRPAHDPASMRGATLAVLPFKPLGSGERDELLELGMADALATQLSLVPGLVVRSSGSVLRYRGPEQDPRRAARELDVDWVVEGSLMHRDGRLRATARLLRAGDGAALWSGHFDERYVDVFDVQDQIARRVTEALASVLQGRLAARSPGADLGGTRSTEAYQLYLAARWRSQDGSADSIRRAVDLLGQALALDPAYAQAWTELAWVHRRGLRNADAEPRVVFERAHTAVQRALALAPTLAHAQAGMGFTRYWYHYDWAEAERLFRSALAANPSETSARWGLALLLLTQGRLDEGFVHLRRARELDPMSPVLNTLEGSFLHAHGRAAEARVRLGVALDIAPRSWLAHVALGEWQLGAGQVDEGLASLRRAAGLGTGTSRPRAVLAAQLAAHGQAAEARTILDALAAQARERFVPPTSLATVHAALGETDAALAALEQAYAVRDVRVIYLKDDRHWAPLRGQPRFAALLRKLALDRLGPGLTPV